PPSNVLQAFGITTTSVPVAGGRGLCFQSGNIILKPSDNDKEAEWVGNLCESIQALQPTEYRTSRPIRSLSSEHEYVVDGWTAWTLVNGSVAPADSLEASLMACRAFHADIAKLCPQKPPFLAQRQNRFTEADLVTWEEKTLGEVSNINFVILSLMQPLLDQLLELRKPLPQAIKNQLIHGDLTGNTLFEEDSESPPGIIDITLYWRPAIYAEAIIVADGLAWLGRERDLVETYGIDEVRLQLLLRALYWRCLTFAIDSDIAWVEENLPRARYSKAVEVLRDFISG
ncbi:ribosomal L1, partial [Fusarium albosuccineum]